MRVTKNWIGALNGEKLIEEAYRSIPNSYAISLNKAEYDSFEILGCQHVSVRLGVRNYCVLGKTRDGRVFLLYIGINGKRTIETEIERMSKEKGFLRDKALLLSSSTGVTIGGTGFASKKFQAQISRLSKLNYKEAIAFLAKCIKNI